LDYGSTTGDLFCDFLNRTSRHFSKVSGGCVRHVHLCVRGEKIQTNVTGYVTGARHGQTWDTFNTITIISRRHYSKMFRALIVLLICVLSVIAFVPINTRVSNTKLSMGIVTPPAIASILRVAWAGYKSPSEKKAEADAAAAAAATMKGKKPAAIASNPFSFFGKKK
jgi:hypothetical protein